MFSRLFFISLTGILILAACAPQIQEPVLPSPQPQPELQTRHNIDIKTVITDGPSNVIDNNTFTFRWACNLASTDYSPITYSTFLDGYDHEYTPFLTDTSRTFYGLKPGRYTFYVKAMDASGNIESEPAKRSFTVAEIPPAMPGPPLINSDTGLRLIGGDVSRIAVAGDGITIYALNSSWGRLYRSDSLGMSWTDISSKISGSSPWIDIAVAPDDPRIVAVSTDGGREIYISTDAGGSFNATGISTVVGTGRAVRCISISSGYGTPRREIAAGLWSGTAGGAVMLNILSNFPSGWFDSGLSGADIFAIKYSPSFPADGTLIAIGSTATKTLLFMGIRDMGSTGISWNTAPGYPVELGVPGIGSAGTPLNYADLALPSDFNGSMPYSRHVIASWSKNHPGQDVYHIFDTQIYRMNVTEPVSSIAYYGSSRSGKLLVGAARCSDSGCYTVHTFFSSNPLGAAPSAPIWQTSQKPPTGSREARVAWSIDGNTAFAGTSGTEAAFSHSRNNGYTWNQ